MKKEPTVKRDLKLKLHRETLLQLEQGELRAVVGGATFINSCAVECQTRISCYC